MNLVCFVISSICVLDAYEKQNLKTIVVCFDVPIELWGDCTWWRWVNEFDELVCDKATGGRRGGRITAESQWLKRRRYTVEWLIELRNWLNSIRRLKGTLCPLWRVKSVVIYDFSQQIFTLLSYNGCGSVDLKKEMKINYRLMYYGQLKNLI